eukprot:SAG11_NODE_959_length_6385_cov_30.010181_6_plen_65_part_00
MIQCHCPVAPHGPLRLRAVIRRRRILEARKQSELLYGLEDLNRAAGESQTYSSDLVTTSYSLVG